MRRLAALLALLLTATAARAEDAISFGLDWVAEAEYGGYYQAVATGLYAKRGLKVTIRQGGPQVNQMQLMMGAGSTSTWAAAAPSSSCSRTCRSWRLRRSSRRTRRSCWRIPGKATTAFRR